MKENSKILITGGAGFIGNWLSIRLAELGHEVISVDNDIRGGSKTADFSNKRITFLQLDLTDITAVTQLFSTNSFDLIYHLAALNGTQNFYERPFDVIKHSSLPIINIINAMGVLNLRVPIIYTGSSESYSRGVTIGCNTVPTSENAEIVLGPLSESRWSYGAAKAFSEYVLQSALDQFGIKFIIARVHNIYGPRMGFNHFISDVISRFRDGDFQLHGSGETRSFCHINDAIFALISLPDSDNAWNQIFNIGSDDERSILSVANMIANELKIDSKLIKPMDSWAGSVNRRCPDISKLKSLLEGEFPCISVDEGIKEMVDWYDDKQITSEKGFK
jgi:UDP-glucose 4-epimerase